MFPLFAFLLISLNILTPSAASPIIRNENEQTGSLTFYKFEMSDTSKASTIGTGEYFEFLPEEAHPLSGVEFTIYKVTDLSNYYSYDSKELPTVDEAEALVTDKTPKLSAVSDENGYIKFDNLELGIYLVQETNSPAQVSTKAQDFCVSIPMTDSTGTRWNYDVVVYPKNETKYGTFDFTKTDENGTPLTGCTIRIYSISNSIEAIEAVTDENGKIIISGLPYGVYKYTEIKAPQGYIIDSTEHSFEIQNDGEIVEAVLENKAEPANMDTDGNGDDMDTDGDDDNLDTDGSGDGLSTDGNGKSADTGDKFPLSAVLTAFFVSLLSVGILCNIKTKRENKSK